MASTIPLSGRVLSQAAEYNESQNKKQGRPTKAYGVFGSMPMHTPKYARHRQRGDSEYLETMARMFIRVPPAEYQQFLRNLKDPDTRKIAACLTGDDAGKGGVGYVDFFLQNVGHSFKEKVDVVETLSDNYVSYFFGQSAPMFRFQGTLLNTFEDDWTMRMFRIYRDLARGTQLARRGLQLRIRYDSVIVTGALVNFDYSVRSSQETACPFNFTLLVTRQTVVYGSVTEPTKLVDAGSFVPEGFLDPTEQQGSEALQTYIKLPDKPETLPEGVFVSRAEADAAVYASSEDITVDAAGNPITDAPFAWEDDFVADVPVEPRQSSTETESESVFDPVPGGMQSESDV